MQVVDSELGDAQWNSFFVKPPSGIRPRPARARPGEHRPGSVTDDLLRTGG